MQITRTMDLHQLNEFIYENFSAEQVGALRVLLNSTRFQRLEEVPRGVWLSMLERVKIQFLMA
ncbi:hypothetical protein [Deinococcus sp. UYEF24]